MSETATSTRHVARFGGSGHGWHVVRLEGRAPAVRVSGPFTTREAAIDRATELDALLERVVAGYVFDTPFETGCVALAPPDASGCFLAFDSDGVTCRFHIAMVTA